MTPRSLSSTITDLVLSLLKSGHAMDVSAHAVKSTSSGTALISWDAAAQNADEFPYDQFGTVKEYLYFLNNRQYSVVLNDGAIIQISYRLKRNKVVWHRLSYHPCPFHFSLDDLANQALADFIANLDHLSLRERLLTKSAIRFDFDPNEARSGHPASHVTLNATCCRIPVRASLDLRSFIEFVFLNFYPELWNSLAAIHALPRDYTASTISPMDQRHMHLHWHASISTL